MVIDPNAVQAALEKLKRNAEPEAKFMRTAEGKGPAYNVQTAVDTEHALMVTHKVTDHASDNRLLLAMAEAAKEAVGSPESLNLVADAGYSNGEQAEGCEQRGIVPHVPANRSANTQGDGHLFDRSEFHYDEQTAEERSSVSGVAPSVGVRSSSWSCISLYCSLPAPLSSNGYGLGPRRVLCNHADVFVAHLLKLQFASLQSVTLVHSSNHGTRPKFGVECCGLSGT